MDKKPTVLVIMDGFGLAPAGEANAISCADTPRLDRLFETCPNTQLQASGLDVGLPDGQIGNSEVGHTNIGAGRVVFQDLPRISRAIEDGSFFENPAYCAAMDRAKARGKALHLLGLVSDGGVHSHLRHIVAAVDMAKRLLASCNNQLNVLADKKLFQLMETKGIGQAKATTLMAAFELSKRLRAERVTEAQHIRSIQDVVEVMQDKLAPLTHEEFWVIFLNQASKILNISQLGKGGLSSAIVDIRLIIREAVILGATHLIVCHNHPSGSVHPSSQDRTLTKQICEAARLMNIQLTDHIILHKNTYYSFLEEGIL